jgi:SET domain-containing protein
VLHREMGVFVSADIEHHPSQALLDYTGEVGNEFTCSPYAITLSAHSLVIDASYLRCFASMINDPSGSDQLANVEFRPYRTSAKHKIRLGVFTLRRIMAGEELLAAYGVQPSTVGIDE